MTKPRDAAQVQAALRFYENMGKQQVQGVQARVVDASGKELNPCHRAVARKLIKAGKAVVVSRQPFTISLNRTEPVGGGR